MTLSEIIEFKANFEKTIKQKLLEFDCFFLDHLWDGYSEDNGQFITEDDFEAIQELSNKMSHMILNIGCPLSVGEMLHSISQRKIKYWASHWSEDHGKQLKTKADRAKTINDCYYYRDRKTKDGIPIKNLMVDKGHFRWNWRAYTLSRRATDLLSDYLMINGF